MIKFVTPVVFERSSVQISYSDKILVIGSCFADNVGEKMVQAGFDVMVNPFGTLYNPVSIANSLSRLSKEARFTDKDCVQMGAGADKFCSFSHHTSFARATKEEFLANANAELEKASAFYKNCNKVIITLGTSFCYSNDGEVVSNCLKRPASEFSRFMLDASRTQMILSCLLADDARDFIFTVSPIRHMADGARANQLSKSSLIVAVNNICNQFPNTSYFPAYEIVMDELRDYRFYAEDMIHPTAQTVNYLWERFADFALMPQEKEKLLENEKLYRQSQHRPITR